MPPRRSGKPLLIIGVIVAVVLVIGGGGAGAFWLFPRVFNAGGAESSAPTRPAAPKFHSLPGGCSIVTRQAAQRLVPGSEVRVIGPDRAGDGEGYMCVWGGTGPRSLRIEMTAYPSNIARSGDEVAKQHMDGYRGDAQASAGRTQIDGARTTVYGRLQELTGLGDEAFGAFRMIRPTNSDQDEPFQVGAPAGSDGIARIYLRVANVTVQVEYTASAQDGTKPLGERAAMQAAQTATRDVVQALNSCTTCGG
ncbi:MAG: hypothetical protein ACRDOO_26850 [Actinomadura sp.]